jgi:hypothetical protein
MGTPIGNASGVQGGGKYTPPIPHDAAGCIAYLKSGNSAKMDVAVKKLNSLSKTQANQNGVANANQNDVANALSDFLGRGYSTKIGSESYKHALIALRDLVHSGVCFSFDTAINIFKAMNSLEKTSLRHDQNIDDIFDALSKSSHVSKERALRSDPTQSR